MPTIKALRENKGWTQMSLAVNSGVSIGTIVRMEHMEPVNLSTVKLVCQALGVSPNDVEGVSVVNRVSKKGA